MRVLKRPIQGLDLERLDTMFNILNLPGCRKLCKEFFKLRFILLKRCNSSLTSSTTCDLK